MKFENIIKILFGLSLIVVGVLQLLANLVGSGIPMTIAGIVILLMGIEIDEISNKDDKVKKSKIVKFKKERRISFEFKGGIYTLGKILLTGKIKVNEGFFGGSELISLKIEKIKLANKDGDFLEDEN